MSDFSELCPLFNTGVYNELHLGMMTGTLYTSATFNFLGGPAANSASPTSFRFGRTIVVKDVWVKRKNAAPTLSADLRVGKRTGTATAIQSLFGTLIFSLGITVFPAIINAWQDVIFSTSMTLNSADVLDISMDNEGTDEGCVNAEIMIQYREK